MCSPLSYPLPWQLWQKKSFFPVVAKNGIKIPLFLVTLSVYKVPLNWLTDYYGSWKIPYNYTNSFFVRKKEMEMSKCGCGWTAFNSWHHERRIIIWKNGESFEQGSGRFCFREEKISVWIYSVIKFFAFSTFQLYKNLLTPQLLHHLRPVPFRRPVIYPAHCKRLIVKKI